MSSFKNLQGLGWRIIQSSTIKLINCAFTHSLSCDRRASPGTPPSPFPLHHSREELNMLQVLSLVFSGQHTHLQPEMCLYPPLHSQISSQIQSLIPPPNILFMLQPTAIWPLPTVPPTALFKTHRNFFVVFILDLIIAFAFCHLSSLCQKKYGDKFI